MAAKVLYTITWTEADGTGHRARATHEAAVSMADALRRAGKYDVRVAVAEAAVRAVPEPALDEPLVGDAAAVMRERLRELRELANRPL